MIFSLVVALAGFAQSADAAGGLWQTGGSGIAWIAADQSSRVVLVDGLQTSVPVASPVGGAVAWIEQRAGFWPRLAVRDGVSTTRIRIPRDATIVSWSPTGTRLLLTSVDYARPARESWIVVDVSSSATWTIPVDVHYPDANPASLGVWSPDGSRIAIDALGLGIAIVDPTARTVVNTSPAEERAQACLDHFCQLAWSPNSARLWYRFGPIATPSFAVVSANGTGRHLVGPLATAIEAPSWAPDSATLGYNAHPTVLSVAFETEAADGTNRHVVLDGASLGGWSPDGTRITGSDATGAFVAHADGTVRVALPNGFWFWSPNSQLLEASDNEFGPGGVRIITRDGASISSTTDAAWHTPRDVQWLPDSSGVTIEAGFAGALDASKQLGYLAATNGATTQTISAAHHVFETTWNPQRTRAIATTGTGQAYIFSTTVAPLAISYPDGPQMPLRGDTSSWLANGATIVSEVADNSSVGTAMDFLGLDGAARAVTSGAQHTAAILTTAVAPDDSRVAFIRFGTAPPVGVTDDRGVYIAGRDGSLVRVVAPGEVPADVWPLLAQSLHWSPRADWLGITLGTHSFVVRADGTGRYTVIGETRSMNWSPDGSRIAFVSTNQAGAFEAGTMNPDGSGRSVAFSRPAMLADLFTYAAGYWSPSGAWVAFSDYQNDVVHIASATTTEDHAIADHDFFPAGWSPDGSKLVLLHPAAHPGLDVYAVPGFTATPLALAEPAAFAHGNAWGAAGELVIETPASVEILGAGGAVRATTPLSSSVGYEPYFAVSPDRALVSIPTSSDLRILDLSGHTVASIPFGTVSCDWAPDGSALAASTSSGTTFLDRSTGWTARTLPSVCASWSPHGDQMLLLDGTVTARNDGHLVSADNPGDTWGPDTPTVLSQTAILSSSGGHVGATVRAVSGSFANALPGTPITLQWLLCRPDGSACQSIAGANTASYTIKLGDRGMAIRVRATARNAAGETLSDSGALLVANDGVIAPPHPTSVPFGHPVVLDPQCAKKLSKKACARYLHSVKAWKVLHGGVRLKPGTKLLISIVERRGSRCAFYTTSGFHETTCAKAKSSWIRVKVNKIGWAFTIHGLHKGSFLIRLRATGGGKTVSQRIKLTS